MDWQKIINAKTEDELKEAKLWLFRESIRIQSEQNELNASREKFIKEREQFRRDMDALNHKMVMEQKRIREDNLFFDKKMEILQDGFRKLDADRLMFESEKRKYQYFRKENTHTERLMVSSREEFVSMLFRNISNPLVLRKRYKDLLKIFHPDNFAGDAELVQMINKEFAKRKEEVRY